MIAVFDDHPAAESAVRKLAAAGLEMKALSVVGRGCPAQQQVTGFCNIGDKMKIWGRTGAFWGGLWGLFLGGMFLAIPVVGHVLILGYAAAAALSAVEGAVVVGGLVVLGAALISIGVPKDSVLTYETDLRPIASWSWHTAPMRR